MKSSIMLNYFGDCKKHQLTKAFYSTSFFRKLDEE
jgi:hypothetical protein